MANRWQEITGPAEWFRLEIPADWTFRQSDEGLKLYSPDGRVRVSVHAFWHAVPTVAPALLLDPHTIFPRAFGLRKLAALQIPQASCGIDGYSATAGEPGLIERMLSPKRKTGWQAWAIRHQEVCLICTIEPTAEPALTSRQKRLVRTILETLEFAAHPVAPPGDFARRLMRHARRELEERPRLVGSLQLAIGDARVNLAGFYRAYLREPEAFDEIVEGLLGTVEQLIAIDHSEIESDPESIRSRIMPMLVPTAVWRESLTEFVSEPWIAGLRIMYVVDEQEAYWYIRESQARQWELEMSELHDLALRNLSEYFERQAEEMTTLEDSDGGPNLLMPASADAYNSVRLLAQPFHRRLQRLLGPQFAVGIPNRDFFVAVSLKDTEMLDRVRGRVAADFKTMDHPLTDRMLIVSADGVSEYCEQG